MALETYSGFIKDLVQTNPTPTDPVAQGQPHLNGIKKTLATQFSGFTEGVAITVPESVINNIPQQQADLNALIAVLVPLLSTDWKLGRADIPTGWVAYDGQLLLRADYPEAWALINAARVPLATDDAAWVAGLAERGKFSKGNGTTTFRVPDLNGKFAGSLGAVFLRGDGVRAGAVNGEIQQDAMQLMTGIAGGTVAYGYSGVFKIGTARPTTGGGSSSVADAFFDNSLQVRTATENRPLSVTGVHILKLKPTVLV